MSTWGSADRPGSGNLPSSEGPPPRSGIKLPILLYHRVGPERAETVPGLNILPDTFERQVRGLKRCGYSGIRPSDWLNFSQHAKPLPRKPIILSFDDGYADTGEYALPILRRYGFNAVMYIVTGEIGRTNRWDQAHGYASLSLMSADDIRYWTAEGIEFGAHSRTHALLTGLSRSGMIDEVEGSAHALSGIVGMRVTSFAYPYGKYNEEVLRVVECNFDLAMSTHSGLNSLTNRCSLLRRIAVQPGHNLLDFALSVKFGRNPLNRMRSMLNSRKGSDRYPASHR